jgi:hypothetical protein
MQRKEKPAIEGWTGRERWAPRRGGKTGLSLSARRERLGREKNRARRYYNLSQPHHRSDSRRGWHGELRHASRWCLKCVWGEILGLATATFVGADGVEYENVGTI